jgi:hypothetical protein
VNCFGAFSAFSTEAQKPEASNANSHNTHLLLTRPPILLLVVAICQLCVLVCAACAVDTLVPGQATVSLVRFSTPVSRFPGSPHLPELSIEIGTHQSSGSSSITNCAAAARALSSFDIFGRARTVNEDWSVWRLALETGAGSLTVSTLLSARSANLGPLSYTVNVTVSQHTNIAHRIPKPATLWRAKR